MFLGTVDLKGTHSPRCQKSPPVAGEQRRRGRGLGMHGVILEGGQGHGPAAGPPPLFSLVRASFGIELGRGVAKFTEFVSADDCSALGRRRCGWVEGAAATPRFPPIPARRPRCTARRSYGVSAPLPPATPPSLPPRQRRCMPGNTKPWSASRTQHALAQLPCLCVAGRGPALRKQIDPAAR